MLTRSGLLMRGLGAGVAVSLPALSRAAVLPAIDATFLVINDVHACRIGDSLSPSCLEEGKTDENLLRHIRALNGLAGGRWPLEIGGKPSGLAVAGQPIERPAGVIVCGDVTDDSGGQTAARVEGPQLRQFSERYRQGDGPDRLHYPVYVGLGNHDLDQDGKPPQVDWYRDELRDYVRMNHRPSAFFKTPVPANNYDELSDNYAWDWGGLHLVQGHRFVGDTQKNVPSSLDWLKRDLQTYASDGRPVILFQHYGWDAFSTERWDPAKVTFDPAGSGPPHWWSEDNRAELLSILVPYNVIAIFHGHEHDVPMLYKAGDIDVFKARAAFMGGFCLVRVTGARLDVAIGEVNGQDDGVTFTNAFSKAIG
jgi:cytolysin (calcineurin-like family phosphatase)